MRPNAYWSKRQRQPIYGGCVFAEDPERSADAALLFWDAVLDRNVIRASAHASSCSMDRKLSLSALPWPSAVLKKGNCEEVAIYAPQGTVRLSIVAGTMLKDPVALEYHFRGNGLSDRLRALQRWDCLLRDGCWPQYLSRRATRADRWPQLLATLDALALGLSLRDTAMTLFGRERVEREWNQTSDHLKMRTRRLMQQARALAAGRYRDLL